MSTSKTHMGLKDKWEHHTQLHISVGTSEHDNNIGNTYSTKNTVVVCYNIQYMYY